MCPDGIGVGTSGSQRDFDGTVEAFRQALVPFLNGDPKPALEFFSRSDDVTLANPLGPPRRGRAEVERAGLESAAQVSEGSIRGFEEVSRYSTLTLATSSRLSRSRRGWPVAGLSVRLPSGSP